MHPLILLCTIRARTYTNVPPSDALCVDAIQLSLSWPCCLSERVRLPVANGNTCGGMFGVIEHHNA